MLTSGAAALAAGAAAAAGSAGASWSRRGGGLLRSLGGGQDVLLTDPAADAGSVERTEVDAMFLGQFAYQWCHIAGLRVADDRCRPQVELRPPDRAAPAARLFGRGRRGLRLGLWLGLGAGCRARLRCRLRLGRGVPALPQVEARFVCWRPQHPPRR